MKTVVSRIEEAAKGSKSITFVTGEEPVTKTWAQLHEESKAIAATLQSKGLGHGDHIALLGPTTVDFVTMVQAVWLIGATLVIMPLPMRLGSIEEFAAATRARIKMSEAAAVLVDPDLAPFVEVGPNDPPLYPFGELLADPHTANDFARPYYDEDDLFVLQFTSGSTSEPKGVVLPNHVMAANLDAIIEAADVDIDTEVMVSWLPLYHDMGLVGFLILPMSHGLDLVLGAPQDFLAKPGRWMEWISTYGGTATAGPNFSYVLATRALRRNKETLDLRSLRIALNGAEPIDPASVLAFTEAGERHGMHPGCVFPAFGMAELAIAGCFPAPMTGLRIDTVDGVALEADHQAIPVAEDHPNARQMVLLGKAVPGLEFRIKDPVTRKVLPDRSVGELQIRGTSVTPGYYKRPDANEELFDGDWLHTGDLAYLIDGEMIMCGRIKDVIIVGGRNVYPQDIERKVGEVEGVRTGNVIAFSVPGRKGKESIVVVAESRADEASEIHDRINSATIEAVSIPASDIVLVRPGTLPKTSSGKLQRGLCRQQYLDEILEPA